MLRKRFGRAMETEAEDVVQETFARLAPQDLEAIRRPQALLMRMATNWRTKIEENTNLRVQFLHATPIILLVLLKLYASPPSEPYRRAN